MSMPNPEISYQPEKHDYSNDLMSYAEYAKLRRGRPYEYELSAGSRALLFMGPGHSNDPENPVFAKIKHNLEEFKPDIVLIEGAPAINTLTNEKLREWTDKSSEEQVIRSSGESVYTGKLAIDRNIKVFSPEPEDIDKYRELESQGFSKEEIFVQEISATFVQYFRTLDKPSLEEYVYPYLQRMGEDSFWDGFALTLDNYKKIFSEITNQEFLVTNEELISQLANPVPVEGRPYLRPSQAAAASSRLRDSFMVNKIAELIKDNPRIFIVYGYTHAVMQEPALRKLMAEYEAR